MSFLQFLGYFIASEIILQGTILCILLLRNKMVYSKPAQGKYKIVTADELLDSVDTNKENWN